MIIKTLFLKEKNEINKDSFSEKRNLIYSPKNTKGKSTYIRLLFYSLGYAIPSMKGIDFNKIYTEITFIEKEKEYHVTREGDLLIVVCQDNTISYTLPSDHFAFLSYIFEYQNIKGRGG